MTVIELNWADKGPLGNVAFDLKRVYYDTVYRATKAALEPVVAAVSDVISEAVSEAIREGINDAIPPKGIFGDFIFGRRGK